MELESGKAAMGGEVGMDDMQMHAFPGQVRWNRHPQQRGLDGSKWTKDSKIELVATGTVYSYLFCAIPR